MSKKHACETALLSILNSARAEMPFGSKSTFPPTSSQLRLTTSAPQSATDLQRCRRASGLPSWKNTSQPICRFRFALIPLNARVELPVAENLLSPEGLEGKRQNPWHSHPSGFPDPSPRRRERGPVFPPPCTRKPCRGSDSSLYSRRTRLRSGSPECIPDARSTAPHESPRDAP